MIDCMSILDNLKTDGNGQEWGDVHFTIAPPVETDARSEVMSMANCATTTTKDLVGVIQTDKRLASEVIDAANCAFYGIKGPVRSLQQAIVLLGLLRLRDIAAGAWGL